MRFSHDHPDALPQLVELLGRIADRALPLVIYNAPFDWPLLIAEARRANVAVPQVPIIDPLVCDRAMDRFRSGRRRLADVAQHYGGRLDHAHDAKADAVAAVAIARAIASRFADVGMRTPSELQPFQAEWFTDWARGLSEFRGERVDAGWPLPESFAAPG